MYKKEEIYSPIESQKDAYYDYPPETSKRKHKNIDSNREGIMSALINLRDKIMVLEETNDFAENNLRSLSQETSRYQDALTRTPIATSTKDVSLEDTERKCEILEKQLYYMNNLVNSAGKSSVSPINHYTLNDYEEQLLRDQIEKLTQIEKRHLNAATMDLTTSTPMISIKKPKSINKKNVKGAAKTQCSKKPTPSHREHYHLDYTNIPFITSGSPSPSHSVPANIQKVLSLMKTHNPTLCSNPHVSGTKARKPKTNNSDLSDLLIQLKEEFAHMSLEHQELKEQILETKEQGLKKDLEREMETLLNKMNTKGDQIVKLHLHQEQDAAKKKKKRTKTKTGYKATVSRISSAGQVDVRTCKKNTIKTPISYVQPNATEKARDFLFNLKQIQRTLLKDDVSWDPE